jgi:cysteine/glycine-rich protein
MASLGGGGVPCTTCGKTSYPAETVLFETKAYHAECFRCTKCTKMIEASKGAAFENKIYCKMCFDREGFAMKQTKVKWTPKASGTTSGQPSKFGGGGVTCNSCQKTAYPGESVQYEMKIYHATCLKCCECSKECNLNNVAHYENKLYCSRCFEKGGYARKQAEVKKTTAGTGTGETKAVSSRFANLGGGGNKCTTCAKTVYPAETLMYEMKPYHIKCFKCLNCHKEMTVNQADKKGDKVYCNKCFMELGLHMPTLNPTNAGKPVESPTASA